MNFNTLKYKYIGILLCILTLQGRINYVYAQTVETKPQRSVMTARRAKTATDSTSITTPVLSIKKDTLVTDSLLPLTQPKEFITAQDEGLKPLPTLLDTTLIGTKTDSIVSSIPSKPRFIPDPQRALWLSLVIPGAGQIYNRKLWKIPIVYGGFLGCLYALTWNNQMYNDYSQAYLDIMDDDPNTKSYNAMLPINFSIEGREDQYKEIFKNKKNYYRKYRDMSIFAMIGVYLLSVVDAYVDAELSSFDISHDLSLKVEPTVFNYGNRHKDPSVGIRCQFSF